MHFRKMHFVGHVPERLAPSVQAAVLRERHHVVDALAAGLVRG